MNINSQYEREYNEALASFTQATKALKVYYDRQTLNGTGRVRYVSTEEGNLLDTEFAAQDRYHKASKGYFGES